MVSREVTDREIERMLKKEFTTPTSPAKGIRAIVAQSGVDQYEARRVFGDMVYMKQLRYVTASLVTSDCRAQREIS